MSDSRKTAENIKLRQQVAAEESARRAKAAMTREMRPDAFKPLPIEQHPKFQELLREYKCKYHVVFVWSFVGSVDDLDQNRNMNTIFVHLLFSTVTSPLYVIALSMQMSIMPNITIYGDVKPKDINKGLLSERIGIDKLFNRKAIATGEKQIVKFDNKVHNKDWAI